MSVGDLHNRINRAALEVGEAPVGGIVEIYNRHSPEQTQTMLSRLSVFVVSISSGVTGMRPSANQTQEIAQSAHAEFVDATSGSAHASALGLVTSAWALGECSDAVTAKVTALEEGASDIQATLRALTQQIDDFTVAYRALGGDVEALKQHQHDVVAHALDYIKGT